MYCNYDYTSHQVTANAINVSARFYEGDMVPDVDPDTGAPLETTHYERSRFLKTVGMQFPLSTSQDAINAAFSAELATIPGREPLWT